MKMKNKKLLIWLMGSNATGKTTQSKLLHESISGLKNKELITEHLSDGILLKATLFDHSGHVGHLKDNQCTGTDTINSKDGVDASFCYLLDKDDISYIIVDGILCTAQWMNIFKQFPDQVEILVVLLQFPTLEDNLRRVVERRVCKKIDDCGNDGADIEIFDILVEQGLENLEEKTLKNVGGKFKGFKSMFEKVKPDCDYSVEIDASLPVDDIHVEILQKIAEITN